MKSFRIHKPTLLEVLMFVAFCGGLMAGAVVTVYFLALAGWIK